MEYETGEFGISVSTENALEGLKTALSEGKMKHIRHLIINVNTLIRNAISVIPSAYQTKDNVLSVVVSDINLISKYVGKLGEKLDVSFFACSYASLIKQSPTLSIKELEDCTDKQKEGRLLIEEVEKLLVTDNDLIRKLDTRLEGWTAPTLLISHIAVDLLSFYQFPFLGLLESHTGAIKEQAEFFTKLRRTAKEPIPFNLFTLNIFGDKSHFLKGQSTKLRNWFTKMATTHKWSAITSLRYMVNVIENDKSIHQADKELLLSLSKVKY